MTTYTLAAATRQLPQLIDRALKGEAVTISLDGSPVFELRPVATPPKPLHNQAALDWFDAHRVGRAPAKLDAAAEARLLRDEGASETSVSTPG